ncbi:hypothetical protein [Saccharicrinis fermentans]|uniref:Uncharacterized protein n=1 Tax=Saccharicrinis fermentans DSM 9555 = JCM 21142 TaxID=869213 RepID=W7Y550_9BACT|nr:hypothetical protein [Saccharicrinis fermentans]GAF03217.1 hypothetical protein JCM21142_41882 [Saccharicrinis fermentans DSM 9555 = JCM 21142]
MLKAKNDKARWNYATWQMKVNLIYDMRKGISDYVDDYSDEQRGEAVLTVLKSARNKDEFRKIIKGLKTPQIGMDSINITDLMTKEQILKYEAIKF